MDNIRERLLGCFATVFPDLSAGEVPRASMSSVATWDSMATINLMMVIEEEFAIQVPPEDLERLVSFESVLSYLQRAEVPAA